LKNKYFGDVNDFRKYGILRGLVETDLNLLVCWMLTDDDNRNDGDKVQYLTDVKKYRYYDPQLFDFLATELLIRNRRCVKAIEESNLLGHSKFISTILNDNIFSRDMWKNELLSHSRTDIVFFDPDNGVEVKSVRKGTHGSSKYIYIDELQEVWKMGASLLIYQHFPRIQRDVFLSNIASIFRNRFNPNKILVFETGHVAFFLLLQPKHSEVLSQRSKEICENWQEQIKFKKM
jgi:hypothetical protein